MGKLNNIKGRKFGKLKALRQVETEITPKGRRHTRWLFRCACGNEKIIRTRNVINMGHTSCGCQRIYTDKSIPNFNALYANYKKRAKERSLEFTLTKTEFNNLTKQNCHYCNKEPLQKYSTETDTPYLYNGLDRIDNNKGYTIENSVPCCSKCNYAKHTQSKDEFLNMIKTIYKNLKLGE